jgi:hypothetical protein
MDSACEVMEVFQRRLLLFVAVVACDDDAYDDGDVIVDADRQQGYVASAHTWT